MLCGTVIHLELYDKATPNSIPNRKVYICPLNYMYRMFKAVFVTPKIGNSKMDTLWYIHNMKKIVLQETMWINLKT